MPVKAWSHDCGKNKPERTVSCLFEVFPRILILEGICKGNLRTFSTNDDSLIAFSENKTKKAHDEVITKRINYQHQMGHYQQVHLCPTQATCIWYDAYTVC